MTGMQGKCFSYPQRIGEDRILRKGKQLVVCSKVDMGEWKVREIRKTVIYINDEAWCLVAKQFSAKEEVRYILDPWPDIASEIPGRIIRYDEEYVSARDNAVKKMRLEARIGPFLYLMSPLIGFLPSRIKAKIEANFGVSARSATLASIIVELLLCFIWVGAFLQIFANLIMLIPGSAKLLLALIVSVLIVFIDLVMRYNSYLREDQSPLGMLEWVWRKPVRNC